MAPNGSVNGNLDELSKIRDILFGSQSQIFEARLTHLEQRLTEESATLRRIFDERLNQIDLLLRQEVQNLRQTLEAEKAARLEAQALMERSVQTKLVALKDTTEQAFTEYGAKLADEVRQRIQDVARLQQSDEVLNYAKMDRAALANLLTEMATKIAD